MVEKSPTVIQFYGPVNGTSVHTLVAAVDRKLKKGARAFTLLISTPGGSVFDD